MKANDFIGLRWGFFLAPGGVFGVNITTAGLIIVFHFTIIRTGGKERGMDGGGGIQRRVAFGIFFGAHGNLGGGGNGLGQRGLDGFIWCF